MTLFEQPVLREKHPWFDTIDLLLTRSVIQIWSFV